MRCWYCGGTVGRGQWTRDHQEPKCLGGTTDPDNLVLACRKCNEEKADRGVEAYRYYLQDKLPAGERVTFYGERP
jgi:5-methylcytosine-specific restriction endonuclease McrA